VDTVEVRGEAKMGQNLSSQRRSESNPSGGSRFPRPRTLRRHRSPNTSPTQQEEGSQSLLGASSGSSLRLRSGGRTRDRARHVTPAATFRRQVSAHSSSAQRSADLHEQGPPAQDAVVYEHEERPLMSVEDIRIGDAPISNITATPMPRSPSVIARLGARLSQRYSSVEPGSFEYDEDGNPWHDHLEDVQPLDGSSDGPNRAHRRHSIFGSITDSLGTYPTSRARRRLASLSRPLASEDSAPYRQISAMSTSNGPGVEGMPEETRFQRFSHRLRSRGPTSEADEAFSGGSPGLRVPDSPSNNVLFRDTPAVTSEGTYPDEQRYIIPPINLTAPLNLDERATSDEREVPRHVDTPIPGQQPRPSWTERLTSRTPTIRREPRRVPNLLRGRSSRLIRRDDEMPLSRILQLAAAAIAAQLSGNLDALANLEAVGDEFDGGLNTFMDDLHSAAGANSDNGESSTEGSTSATPLNFWRAFRFMGSASSPRSMPSSEEDSDARTVTLVVVGVRSVPSSSLRDPLDSNETSLDNLLSDMSPPLSSGERTRQRRSFLRSLGSRSSTATPSRPSSFIGTDLFPAPYESQRHSRAESRRSRGVESPAIPETDPDHVLGPRPPPTTPAHTSSPPSTSHPPSRRTSMISGLNVPLETDSSSTSRASPAPGPIVHAYGEQPIDLDTIPDPPPVRRRRRSDSELARAENLASHRNGTIDPDGGPLMGRSWLIYVVGTNLPADHPIFQVPSLLSDVCLLRINRYISVLTKLEPNI
jgi:hypothetical protein